MLSRGHNIVYLLVRYNNDKSHTFIGSTNNFEARLREHNSMDSQWVPVMILRFTDDRDHGIKSVRDAWKRNARGLDSRVKYGFKIAKQYTATVYVHSVDTPVLNFVNDLQGEPKPVESSFWEQF